MRLIDADTMNEKLFYKQLCGKDTLITAECAFNMINKQPTEEEKSVHGEWIKIKDWDENDNAIFECNNCHHADTHAKSVKVPYCWYCGAKMSYVDMRGKNNGRT